MVKFFYLMQLFNNTISIHPEMYHHSLLGTFIAQIIWPFENMYLRWYHISCRHFKESSAYPYDSFIYL